MKLRRSVPEHSEGHRAQTAIFDYRADWGGAPGSAPVHAATASMSAAPMAAAPIQGHAALVSCSSRFSTPARPSSTVEAHAGHFMAQLPTELQSVQRYAPARGICSIDLRVIINSFPSLLSSSFEPIDSAADARIVTAPRALPRRAQPPARASAPAMDSFRKKGE